MRMPTRRNDGEGRVRQGSNRQMHLFRSAGIMGTARWKGDAGNRGRPIRHEGSDLNVVTGQRCRWESDRVIRPLRPGNAGGGKDPDFWCASEEDEDR
jgi:hypothetical protein